MADEHLGDLGAATTSPSGTTAPTVNHGPIGVTVFADDFKSIRPFAERDNTNIVSWTEHPRGGHFASLEVPDVVVDALRRFYASSTAGPER